MDFRYVLPCSRLEEYIDYYLVIEHPGAEGRTPVVVYPSPQAGMAFNYGGKTSEQVGANAATDSNDLAISGFFTKKATYCTQGRVGVIMVGFKPWCIQSFLSFQTEEIINTNLDLRLVYPMVIREIGDRLLNARGIQQRIQIVEQFLLSILKEKTRDELIIHSVGAIFAARGTARVGKLSKEACLSEKQFARRFKSCTGINPKLFSRLVRFQYIVKLLDGSRLDLLDHAIESGFYDAAHFIHEFEEFTSMSPSEYVHENVRSELGQFFDSQIAQSPYYNLIYQ